MRTKLGFSIIETLIATTIMTLIVGGAAQLTISIGRSFNRTTTQLKADQLASRSVQWMTQDLAEAKQVVINSSSWLRVYYPIKDGTGAYDRLVRDDANPIDYFRGDTNGTQNPTGTAVIRKSADGSFRVVCKGVSSLLFASSTPSSVDVSLSVSATYRGFNAQCNMVHRAIFLRNN